MLHLSFGGVLRTSERDFLLILLAIAAGAADAWAYVAFGHAFVANLTGNTVLIGLAIFNGHDLGPRLTALLCYLPGAAFAAWLTRRVECGSLWPPVVSRTLLLEGGMLFGAEAGWSALQHHGPIHAAVPVPVLLGVVAFAVGMQSGAMLQLDVPGIVTTYISGTWTILVSGLATFRSRESGKPDRQRHRFEERLLMQGGIIAAYLAAAVFSGWLARFAPGALGLTPACAVVFASVYGLARQRS